MKGRSALRLSSLFAQEDRKRTTFPSVDAACPGECRGVVIPGRSVDLHVHSTASDGLLPPDGLARLAVEKDLAAIAITDHDTTSGVQHLSELAGGTRHQLDTIFYGGVEIVPAVEINSQWEGRELHILGYFVPLYDSPFQDLLRHLRDERRLRAGRMIAKLRELGMPIDKDRVLELAKGESVGRPHIAAAMIEKGYVATLKEAFDDYIGMGKMAYVEREHLSPKGCVTAIRDSGGVAAWAHPVTASADHLLRELVECGLQVLEAYHPELDRKTREKYVELAKRHNLRVTGGSDYHGPSLGEGRDLGDYRVGYEVIAQLRELSNLA